MTQTITGMYDNHADALSAQSKLVALGIPETAIKLLSGAPATQAGSVGSQPRDDGFWGSLKDFFMPEEDRHAYSEGLSRGGTMLSASVDDAHLDAASDILEEHGSVDLDEREATWRKEGWDGRATGTAGSALAAPAGTTGMPLGAGSLSATEAGTTGASGAVASAGTVSGGTEYIPVVEERLNVGKRMVDSGRVRVRSYAVAKDVSENVTLHDESVHVDRRAVDRTPTAVDEALFADKTIEATEMREQAVVSKDARVVEEVGIRKQASDRVETVSDTVRHTEVEVTDERGNVSRSGTTDTAARKPL